MNQIPHIKITFFLLLFFGVSFSSNAQHKAYLIGRGESKLIKLEEAAVYAFKNQDYYSAYRFYQDALSIDSLKVVNRYGLAKAAERYGAFCVASEAYDKVVAADTAAQVAFPNAKLKAGEMKKMSGDVDQADIILMDLKAAEIESEELNRQLADLKFIENAWNEEKETIQPLPVNLGPIINTQFAEFSPVWRNGALYYGSLAYTKKKDKVRPRREFSKILRTKLNGETEAWDSMNIADKSVGHLSFTPADDRMYFTICDYIDQSSNLVCQLYYKDKIGESANNWGTKKPLPPIVNNPNFTNTQPSVGLNENGEQVLYFVSNRPTPESMGGMDIWYTKINEDNTFSAPINLGGHVNTARNEITPFYHFPTETLYFSSDGYKGFGGYDINKTTFNTDGTWGEIENIKEPFNSSHHDFNFFLKEEGREAFFVSGREGCEVEQGCHDIFRIDIPTPISNTEVLVNLFDAETRLPIAGGSALAKELAINGTALEVGSNAFTFPENTLEGTLNLIGIHPEYLSETISVTIEKFKKNSFDIYLPCKPSLTVKVLTKMQNGEYGTRDTAINNATVTLMPKQNATGVPKKQASNSFDFEVDRAVSYVLEVSHPFYDSKSMEFSVEECAEEKVVYLELEKKNAEFDTIACYFHHDIPARKIKGVPDPSTDLAYNEFYQDYMALNRTYQNKFMAGEVGAKRLANQQAVVDFFETKVNQSFLVLERFKNDLLAKLAVLPEGQTYIVYIRGFTSKVGTNEYNDELAQRRINSVKNYFTKTHIDDFGEYLFDKKSLIFEEIRGAKFEKGFDKSAGKKNTVYNPKSAINRRVEIIRAKGNSGNSLTETNEE